MCRCAERRTAVSLTVAAVLDGDLAAARQEAAFVLRSSAADLAAAARRAASHARLRR